MNTHKRGGVMRDRIAQQVADARAYSGRRKNSEHRYEYYTSDLATTTRLFGGINPKKEVIAYVKTHGAANVVELACGKGATLGALQTVKGAKLFGTNLTTEREFREIKANIKVCHFGQVVEKFGEKSMDFAYTSMALHNSKTMLADLGEIAKLIKPNGRLLVNLEGSKTGAVPGEVPFERRLHTLGFRVLKTAFADVEARNPIFGFLAGNVTIHTFYAEKVPEKPKFGSEDRPASRLEWFRRRYGLG